MNYDDLNNLDQKDLHIIYLKSLEIMSLREQEIINAIKAYDIAALNSALKHNKDKILSSGAWREIYLNMQSLIPDKLEFFLFIKSFPEFEEYNSKIGNSFTLIQQAVCKGFFHVELFDFFVRNKEYSSILKNMVNEHAIVDTVPKEVIHKLFQSKILKPTKKLLDKVLNDVCFNYLEYFLDNNIYQFNEEDYTNIYNHIWAENNYAVLEKIKELFPNHSKIPLSNILDSNCIISSYSQASDKDFEQKKYVLFVGLNKEIFSRTLKSHKITKAESFKCIKAFNSRKHNIEENFHCLVQTMIEIEPEYYNSLKKVKGIITSKNFLLMYNKAMNYAELNINLEKRECKEKKLKL